MKPVLLMYKNRGETPLECLERFKKNNALYKDIPMTYAGRLDPMAEGLLLVLTGEECKKKDKYLSLPKTYEFEILWGFETDTYDLLGLITNQDEKVPVMDLIQNKLKNYIGKQKQVYPPYSSKTINGRSLFNFARQGKINDVELPEREVEIFSLSYFDSKNISGEELKNNVVSRVSMVSGDFRQDEIKGGWAQSLNEKNTYTISSFEMGCSSGTYVRAFVQKFAKDLGVCGTAFSIKRTNIGNYSLPRDRVSR